MDFLSNPAIPSPLRDAWRDALAVERSASLQLQGSRPENRTARRRALVEAEAALTAVRRTIEAALS